MPGTYQFQNWSGAVTVAPKRYVQPATQDELDFVLAAATSAHLPVRVVGAGHSFTPVAATDGVLINLDRLSGIISVDRAQQRVRFHAGTRLRDVPDLLAPYGLALANQGDVNPQSIAGAVSTGTHGTGLGYTGFAGMVTGLTLLLANGTLRRLSATEHPEQFNLARLSLGAVGIITEVELQCTSAFDLIAQESVEDFWEMVTTFAERSRRHDHVEFFWFPYTSQVMAKTNTRIAPDARADWSGTREPAPRSHAGRFISEELLDNGVFHLSCRLSTAAPRLTRALNRAATTLGSQRCYRGRAHEVFVSPRRVRFNEMEYAVPLEALVDVMQDIKRAFKRHGWPIGFPIEVRATAADDVPLSTAYGRESAYIAVHRYIRQDYESYFAAMESIFVAHGGRPHWGKMHTRTATELTELYPRFTDFTELRRELDPQGVFATPYLDDLFGGR
ncbi:D-arabinono-1,4-lactone oxidase [Gulosibacter bifidus]|uniref:D-arabinono-1,4-lactone oxidase n=1 Tax=Gulosibacter bifidus TaxID=272239 RepID=A0ABW5RI93_9MICO|nr:D-arabinono-1,4-lactone oxidase [Gulosibacter bifidus]